MSFDWRNEDLKAFFAPYGKVSSAKVIVDKMTDKSRGFGFVEMANEAAGRKAIAELNGAMTTGRPMKVNEAKPKSAGNLSGPREKNYNNSASYNQTIY